MKKVFLFMAFLMGMTINAVAQTATDNYLNIVKYKTITGWESGNIDNLYVFNEVGDDTWLTLSVYGAYVTSASRPVSENYVANQKWITLDNTSPLYRTVDNGWNSSGSWFHGSSAYYKGSQATRCFGNYNTSNTTRYTISFYVTNTDQVKLFLIGGYGNNATYAAKMIIYECDENLAIQGSAVDTKQYTTSSTSAKSTLTSITLNPTKIYKVECSTVKSGLLEIAFHSPLKTTQIIAEPTSLGFTTTIGTPQTKTVNVKGVDLQDVITATIIDDNGNVFSIDAANISVQDATSGDGKDVSITFDPQEEGEFTGKLILSNRNAYDDVEIPLTGTASSEVFEMEISTVGLSTLYLDYPVAIPYDNLDLLGVYYIHAMNGTEMRATRLNNSIPANTGVIVQGNAGTYNFIRIAQADPLPASRPNSLLKGCVEETEVADVLAETPGTIYTLGRGKDQYINFWKYTGSTLYANKAYYLLEGNNNAKALTLSFDGDATGINTVNANNVDGAWYNLQGIQVQGKPTSKGVFIHNGKKVVVK